jgi:hypothetical protein
VTPGTTPGGTRPIRTFFVFSDGGSAATTAASGGSAAEEASTAAIEEMGWGGGEDSRAAVNEGGNVSIARRKSVFMKSRCFWEAWRLMRISEYSSDC